jgi:3-phenylpropionate/cinnamic acid dioxygenase small subunit
MGERESLQMLLDKWDIHDVLMRYARAADRCDAALWAGCFHPGARIWIGNLYDGPAEGFAERAVAALRALGSTQHFITNPLIEIAGDVARVECYATAWHRLTRNGRAFDCLVGGRYLDRFERRGGAWRIAERRYVFDWNRDLPACGAEARERLGWTVPVWGRRDPDDASYRRLPGFPAPRLGGRVRRAPPGEAELREVLDRQAIRDVLNRYSHNLDRCNEAGLRRVFHSGSRESHAGLFEGSGDEFCTFAMPGMRAIGPTSHPISNALVEVEGDRAYCESYVWAQQRMTQFEPGFDLLIGARYLDHLERRDGRWAIVDRYCVADWVRDEPIAETLSRGLLPMISPIRGVKDRSDPVYRDMHGAIEPPATLEEAAVKQAITEVIYRYARGVDRADLATLRSCFHPDGHENHMGMMDGNAWDFCAAAARGFPTVKRMHHAIANVGIELRGEVAFVESYTSAYQRLQGEAAPIDCMVAARSLDRMERRAGEWRIADRRVILDWNQDYDDGETMMLGLLDPQRVPSGTYGPGDPSYQLLAPAA